MVQGALPPRNLTPLRPPHVHTRGWMLYALTGLVILAALFHSSSSNDPYRCDAAFESGVWLDPPLSKRSKIPYSKWQPDGCTLNTYRTKEIAQCLGSGDGSGAIFIGDSTAREVFWAFARKVNSSHAALQEAKVEKHADIAFKHNGIDLEFLWDPYLNHSHLLTHLEATRANALDAELIVRPMSYQLVVVGAGLWFGAHIKHGADAFKLRMDRIAEAIHRPHHKPPFDQPGVDRLFFLPIQAPYYDHLDTEHKSMLKPADINDMNNYMRDMPVVHGIDVPFSLLRMGANAGETHQTNGIHVTNTVANEQAEMLLNIRCNNGQRSYPFYGTCCYDYPQSWSQLLVIVVGFVGLAIIGWALLQDWLDIKPEGPIQTVHKYLSILRPSLIMWAALFYCYLADRTHLFNKVHKQYNNQDFFILLFGIVIAGALQIKESASPRRSNQEKATLEDQPVLSRDQTDEWKGWMQALILAYHYTGASSVLWIYKIIRLLVASYLFMTGYGHTAYFYQKADYSLKRVVAVNIRLNLLSCLLPWTMQSDYMFYYFAPLVTYWYAVVYFTMRVKHDWNKNLPFFLGKIACSALLTSLLHTQHELFEPLFHLINMIFGSKWEAKEWFFRCALDQYIVYVGMILAVLYIRNSKPPPPPPPPQDPIATTSHTEAGRPPRIREVHYFIASGVSLVIYALASSTRTTKTSSNQLHPYISPLAVLAFVHLRNCTRTLRNNYSTAYRWLGRISLETFVLQYHIWLAADTKGLLSTGLFGNGEMYTHASVFGAGMGLGRWIDCILLGVVFMWISSKVADATGDITSWTVKRLFG